MKIHGLFKMGWSLLSDKDNISNLMRTFEEISDRKNIVITTWSNNISDLIRDRLYDLLWKRISEENHIDVTWKARDIVAQSMADMSNIFVATRDLWEVNDIVKSSQIPIIVQYDLLRALNPFPLVRWLSTDTTSAFFADVLNAEKFVKLTDVDGIYENIAKEETFISSISTTKLRKMWKTCVDIEMANFLDKIKKDCYILGGKNTKNIKDFFLDWVGKYTRVRAR